MRKIDHIERQILELSSSEFAELREWVLERDRAAWDAQIERDSRAGKLDKMVTEASDAFRDGASVEM